MKKALATLLCLSLSATIASWILIPIQSPDSVQMQQASRIKFHKMRDAVIGKYIVKLNDNIPSSEVPSLATQLTKLHGGLVEYIFQDVLKGFSVKQMSEQQAVALSGRPEVSSVEEGARVVITGQQPMPAENTVIKPLAGC